MSGQLRIAGLEVAYGGSTLPSLAGISFTLDAGETLCVVGESGSGKSTLAMAVAGLLPPDARTTGIVNWRSTGRGPRRGVDVGVIFQDPAGSLDPVMAVGRQIAEIVRVVRGVPAAGASEAARKLLADVGFTEADAIFAAFPHQLSGGQAQRIAIACALAADPSLLIADEATSALDTIVQAEIAALLRRLVAEQHLSLLFITHDLALARSMSERVLILKAGRQLADGSFDATLRNPPDDYVVRLLAAHIGLSTARLVERR